MLCELASQGIANSVWVDFLRCNRRRPLFSSLTDEFDREDGRQLPPEAWILMREDIQEGLKRLTPPQRKCLELTIVKRATPDEMARELDLEVGTVITYVCYGRKAIRNALFSSEKEC